MKEKRTFSLTSSAVTASLGAAAVISFGFWLALALSGDDVGRLESPLLLVVAHQVRAGPWELYGPFGGRNPLVLIHAPLYYRLAALCAWRIAAAGISPVTSALIAGRALSIFSLIATAAAAYRLARLDRARKRTGWWAALLFLASPLLGGTAFSVRPDMMGVALQTAGVMLVVSCLQDPSAYRVKLTLAFALFGLAICTKQQLIIGPLVSLALVAAAWRQGRLSLAAVVSGPVVATAIAVTAYGIEQKVSGGLMAAAVFGAAANVSRVHPGSWLHIATVLAAVLGNGAGLVALLGAAAVAKMGAGATIAPGARLPICFPSASGYRFAAVVLRSAAIVLVAGLACLTVLQLFWIRLWLGWIMLAMALLILLFAVPAVAIRRVGTRPETTVAFRCAKAPSFAQRKTTFREAIPGQIPSTAPQASLDTALWIYCAGEVVLLVVLSRLSDGAWVNYAIQAMLYAAVLAARALSRALEESTRPAPALLAILASLAVPAAVCLDLKAEATRRRSERAAATRLVQTLGGGVSRYFFAERPAFNRLAGHVALVYDDWLYPVFESSGLAENRSRWLGKALADRGIRFVVTTAEYPPMPGIEATPLARGPQSAGAFGPFRAYEIVVHPERER